MNKIKAIEIEPNNADSYSNRGLALNDKGNFIQAISDFTKALEIDPKDTFSYSGRMTAYLQINDYDKCWVEVHKVEKLRGKVDPKFLKDLKKPQAEIVKKTGNLA